MSGHSWQTRREKAHAVALTAAADGVTAFRIDVADAGSAFPCRPGQTVLVAATSPISRCPSPCGEGSCGTCRVRVLAGADETDNRGLFSAAELAAGWQLACQTLPTGDVTISRAAGAPEP